MKAFQNYLFEFIGDNKTASLVNSLFLVKMIIPFTGF